MSTTAEIKPDQVTVSSRTLRRAIQRGAIRGRRLSSHRFSPAQGEKEYLTGHWELLDTLHKFLGAKPTVRFAILYGSTARGDDVEESDIDILVKFSKNPSWQDIASLSLAIESQIQKKTDIADWDVVYKDSPLLALQAVDDGRVLVDKDSLWHKIKKDRSALYARAQRRYLKDVQETGWSPTND